MYAMINDTKIIILAETHDSNILTLHIKPDLSMQETYDLFNNGNLQTIILYNDDDTMHGVHVGYSIIDSFLLKSSDKEYVINLAKVSTEDIKNSINECVKKVDNLKQNVVELTEGDLAKQNVFALEIIVSTFTDEQASKCALLFPKWNPNSVSYNKNDRVQYNNKLYKVLSDHVSQSNWTPDSASSLFVEISDPNVEWPEWKKPTSAEDAYNIDDKITYNTKHYISLINSNVWSPEEYSSGWKLCE